VRTLAAALLVALVAAGCGSGSHGSASVWVTRDRGAHVLLVKKVPAGETAMQALDRVADIRTRYGGRFVQAINGVEGSLAGGRDWFYFVNGYEADRSAAEYVLHPGDVEWWDFRSWKNSGEPKVVVGAFPEPFLHGYDGKRRATVVVAPNLTAARGIAKLLHGRALRNGYVPLDSNILMLKAGSTSFTASAARPGGPVRFTYSGDWHDLLKGKYRYRYSVP
jgi:Domain of unknown function (DUF4430)